MNLYNDFLIKIGGDHYLPRKDCNAVFGCYENVKEKPIFLSVDSSKPIKPYLNDMVDWFRDYDCKRNERVNLLHQDFRDSLIININIIGDIFDLIFTDGKKNLRVKSYNGKIHAQKSELDGKTVRDFFGDDVNRLELAYVCSHDLDNPIIGEKSDHSIVESHKKQKRKHRTMEMIDDFASQHRSIPTNNLFSLGTVEILALKHIYENGPIDSESLLDKIKKSNVVCGSELFFHRGFDDYLSESRIVKNGAAVRIGEPNGASYIANFRYTYPEKIETLNERYSGLNDNLDNDLMATAIALAVDDGNTWINDINRSVRENGVEPNNNNFDSLQMEVGYKLKEMVGDGVLIQDGESFEINPEFRKQADHPDQGFLFPEIAETIEKRAI